MPPIFRVTHQPQGKAVHLRTFPVENGSYAPPALSWKILSIGQDFFERRDIHFLTGQTVYAIRNGDIENMVFKKDFNIDSCQLR